MSYVDRVRDHAQISHEEYVETMKEKRAAILTRQFGISNLKDNEIY